MAEIGIKTLKKDLTSLAKLVNAVDKALEDGKINITEGIGIAFKAIDIFGIIKNMKAAKEELLDLDENEINQLTDHFQKEFDLRNDQAEEAVEMIIDLALNVVISMDFLKEIKTQ